MPVNLPPLDPAALHAVPGVRLGVAQAGPTVAAFFGNLTPLFAALLGAAILGEWPQAFHALAFGLIVAGIVVSSRPARAG